MTGVYPPSAPACLQGPLHGLHVVSVALNLPGPVAVRRLQSMGARVTTVLPPGGDPVQKLMPRLFAELHEDQTLEIVDMRDPREAETMRALLAAADIFVTSHRSGTLNKLGLDFGAVSEISPGIIQTDITGYPDDRADLPGHDINYQAAAGLLVDKHLPTNLVADMHGSERAVSATLAALHLRREQGESQHVVVALSEAAEAIALPVRHGMTGSSSPLGGASPFYGVYESSDGCIALGALETHFARSLATSLGVEADTDVRQQLDKIFREKTSQHWQDWAEKTNLPIMALKSIPENS